VSAVWRAARAAVGRRKLQTFVIGLVVLLSTTTIVVALTLLDASSAPFDRSFAQHNGAHAIAVYDPAKVTGAQLAGQRPGVAAAAGPFGQLTTEVGETAGSGPRGMITVVGRADPGGPVDRLNLWEGRWATGPGEVVLGQPPSSGENRGVRRPTNEMIIGGQTFTIVGWAFSISESADAWVSPEQMAALKPTGTQMLYRFTGDVSSAAAVDARLDEVTGGLPADALIAAQSYTVVKDRVGEDIGAYIPLLATFGVLGLIVAIVIVGNVVSGAVVSGFRHIGVLKALGFTPVQVVAVYLAMVSVPALVGCVLGTVAGSYAAKPLLSEGFEGLGLGGGIGTGPWIWAVGLLGVPLLVAVTAFVPAMRAHRLSAAEAISAGSAPRIGRGVWIQRRLSGVRLPRAVTLGLGLPFARPGRTVFTVAAVLLGVTTVTFATGLAGTLNRISTVRDTATGQIAVRPSDGRSRMVPEGAKPPPAIGAATTRTDAQVEELLRGLPDAARVTAIFGLPVVAVGQTQPLGVAFVRGDVAAMGYQKQLTAGRWMRGPDETVVASEIARDRGLKVGDTLTLELDGRRTDLTLVGVMMDGPPGPKGIVADWSVLTDLAPDRDVKSWEVHYQVQLVSGGDVAAYVAAVMAADPGIDAWDTSQLSDFALTVIGFSSALALLLALVAAIGVFNTVVLNVRERRRDLGMLKSIGMTPRQVVAMVLTSMALVGVAGGLLGIPLGVLAHRFIVPAAAESSRVQLPDWVLNVWPAPTLALLALAGLVIALLGALVPARGAARLTIAEVLHNE
jgi:ABC-type lipoprotein release transport system permease subunit